MSKEVKRYDCTDGGKSFCQGCYTMTETEYGDYVQAEDYDDLASENAELRTALDTVDRLASARLAENERLHAALTAYDQPIRVAVKMLDRTNSPTAMEIAAELRGCLARACEALSQQAKL